MTLSITQGEGRSRPQGRTVELPAGSPVDTMLSALSGLPARVETWWSPHRWDKAYREAKAWAGASGVAIDVDYETREERELSDRTAAHRARREPVPADLAEALKRCRERRDPPPPDLVAGFEQLARTGTLPGSLFHLTPHGARVVFVFAADCSDPELYRAAARGAGALVAQAIGDVSHELGVYRIDAPLLEDLGRLFYAPCANAKGVQRQASVLAMQAEPYTPEALAEYDMPAEDSAQPLPSPEPKRTEQDFAMAAARWNAEHQADWPRAGGDCPACGHRGCFGRMPDDDSRWFCWSTDHSVPGIRGANGHHGDALDLEAHARGRRPAEVLHADGYLETRILKLAPPVQPADGYIDTSKIRNNSYLSVVTILRRNLRDVLGDGGALRLNAMTGRQELAGVALCDEEVSSIRALIEARVPGGVDKHGDQIGLRVKPTDLHSACDQVAYENVFHPVQDYLRSLTWDGVERLDAAVEDILGAERTVLNQAIVRRFMTGAVARAMNPGCKVDTVLVLVGKQGCGKSSFFRLLAGGWFVDTSVDLRNKDAYQVLRNAWIYEWAELEVLRRSKDASAAKAFLTSQVDTYRPSHGRKVVDVPRSCIIVGSTNDDEFLSDPSGNRRFWPLRVGASVDLVLLVDQRDQLWAEAYALHDRGEPWWLTPNETTALASVHTEHAITDPWEGPVEAWAERQAGFSTADVLTSALEKPRGQWSKTDEMRVANLLKASGWSLGKKPKGSARRWSR